VLAEDRVGVAGMDEAVGAGYLDEFRARDVLAQVAAELDRKETEVGPMDDERRHVDRRQHVADIDAEHELRDGSASARARAHPLVPRPPLLVALVVRRGWAEDVG